MIISIEAEITLTKQLPIHEENSQQVEIKVILLKLHIYKNPTANITLIGEKLNAFLQRQETRQGAFCHYIYPTMH
jgi:hypothetical protein